MDKMRQNREFIDKICTENWKELYRFVYYKVQNREEAEDITQETYVKVISYLDNHDVEILEFGNYLKTVAINIIRDRWRMKSKKGNSINLEEVNPEEIAIDDFTDAIHERSRIEEAIRQLSKDFQKVIDLRIMKGFSVADTAKQMNKRQGTVRVLQYRAIKALTQTLEDFDRLGGLV